MSDGFQDIGVPVTATASVTAVQVTHGPTVPPQQLVLLYSPSQWEEFIQEWAHYALKSKYMQVQRFGGAGDKGLDIVGFADGRKLQGVWDTYQCKRFLDHAVYPSEAWPEIGKVLWYSFKEDYKPPRKYYFVAPHGVGTTLLGHLANPTRLKHELLKVWDKNVKDSITDTQEVLVTGAFAAYVDEFDFSIFDSKTTLEVVDDHRRCPCFAARFGGGLKPRPAAGKPPDDIAPEESRYVSQLLGAYADHKKQTIVSVTALKTWPPLEKHFDRQREAFYEAESLRVFARDSVPAGTFESLQEDIHTGVVDVCDGEHPDGYERVKQVTRAARELALTSNALIGALKPKDRDGICHQLANEDRLEWTKS